MTFKSQDRRQKNDKAWNVSWTISAHEASNPKHSFDLCYQLNVAFFFSEFSNPRKVFTKDFTKINAINLQT